MKIKYVICLLFIFLSTLTVNGYSEDILIDSKYARIRGETYAYYEPNESDDFCIGKFLDYSIVEIEETIEINGQQWSHINYYYEPIITMDYEDKFDNGIRSVYVHTDDLISVPSNLYTKIEKNQIIKNIPFDKSTYEVFEPSLLIETMEYKKAASGNIQHLENNSSGDAIDEHNIQSSFDIITATNTTYAQYAILNIYNNEHIKHNTLSLNNSKDIIYITGTKSVIEAYNLTGITSVEDSISAGIKTILENAPPYKEYICYPGDYKYASEISAILALNTFLNEFAGENNCYNMFEDIQIKVNDEFNKGYIGYAYWLYEEAVKAYTSNDICEAYYLTYELEVNYEQDSWYVNDVRITTNDQDGWFIRKDELPDGLTIRGYSYDDNYAYYGNNGSSKIKLIQKKQLAQPIENINIYYVNSPYYVYELKVDTNNCYLLTNTLSSQIKKKINLTYPVEQTITFQARTIEGNPVEGVAISITEKTDDEYDRSYTVKTNNQGIATINQTNNVLSYRVDDIPVGYEFNKDSNYTVYKELGQTEDIIIYLIEKKGNLEVNVAGSILNNALKNIELTVRRQDNDEITHTIETDKNGVAKLENLTSGLYTLTQQNSYTGYQKNTGDNIIEIKPDETTYFQLLNEPLKGTIHIQFVDKVNKIGIPKIDVVLIKGKEIIAKTTSDETGNIFFDELQTGKYTFKTTSIPSPYEKTTISRTLYIKKDQINDQQILITPHINNLTIYPRSAVDLEETTAKKSVNDLYNNYIRTISYAIYANDTISINNTELYFKGQKIQDVDPVEGKYSRTNTELIYPGAYKLVAYNAYGNEITSYAFNLQYDPEKNMEIYMEINVPIAKLILTASPNSEYYIYPTSSKTYKLSDVEQRYIIKTDNNGIGNIESIIQGEYYISDSKTTGKNKELLIIEPQNGINNEIYFDYQPEIERGYIRIVNVDESGNIIYNSQNYILSDGTNEYAGNINGIGCLPIKLPCSHDYTLIPMESLNGYKALHAAQTINIDAESVQEITVIYEKKPIDYKLQFTTSSIDGYLFNKDDMNNTIATPYYSKVPLEGVGVKIQSEETEETYNNFADANGVILLNGLMAINYIMQITYVPEGYILPTETYLLNLIDTNGENNGQEIDIRKKEITLHIEGLTDDAQYAIYAIDANNIKTINAPIVVIKSLHGIYENEIPLEAGKYELIEIKEGIDVFYDNDITKISSQSSESSDNKFITIFSVNHNTTYKYVSYGTKEMNQTKITVIDTEGNGLSNAYVEVASQDETYSSYTDESGETIFMLPDGEYTCKILLAPEKYAVPEDEYTFNVNSLQDEVEFDTTIILEKQRISMKVTDENGIPVENALFIMKSEAHIITEMSDANGIISFGDVPYGNYLIEEYLAPEGWIRSEQKISIEIDGTTRQLNDVINEPLINNVNKLHVLCNSNKFDKENVISIFDMNGNQIDTVYTDANGQAEITSLPYGVYYVNATNDVNEIGDFVRKVVIGKNYSNSTVEFNFTSHIVRLTLVDNKGQGIYGIKVNITNLDDISNAEAILTTDSNGVIEYEFEREGNYIIHQTEPIENLVMMDDIELYVDKDFDETTYKQVLVDNNYEFQVINSEGEPLPDIEFIVMSELETNINAISDANGIIRIRFPRKGTYTVLDKENKEVAATINVDENYDPKKAEIIYLKK